MSCIVVRTEFLNEHPEVVRDFLEAFAASAAFPMENVQRAAELIGEFEIMPEAIALQAIPYSNIESITGQEMIDAVMAYLAVLYEQSPAAVGGMLPDEGFFFTP